jgi:hypothetical protein
VSAPEAESRQYSKSCNYKYRPPFPRLPRHSAAIAPATCSVCGGPFSEEGIHQAWISLRDATDVLPLLVHACSGKCIQNLPKPPVGYLQQPHFGGLDLKQPPTGFGIGDLYKISWDAPFMSVFTSIDSSQDHQYE